MTVFHILKYRVVLLENVICIGWYTLARTSQSRHLLYSALFSTLNANAIKDSFFI